MARFKAKTVEVPVSVAAGAATSISDFSSAVITLTGTFTGTYQVQVSMDGTNYYSFGSALTAAGQLAITHPCLAIRLNCTAYTSGTPVCLVSGSQSKPVY